jgi:hypothetical protein
MRYTICDRRRYEIDPIPKGSTSRGRRVAGRDNKADSSLVDSDRPRNRDARHEEPPVDGFSVIRSLVIH